jgi:hypothetical protein
MSPPAPSRPAPNGTSASTRHPQPAPGFRDAARLVLEHQAGTALPSWSDHRDVASLASLAPALVRRQDTAAASEHRADRPRQARSALSCAMPTIVCAADRVWVEAEPRSTLYEVGPGVTFSSVRHASPAPRVIRTFGSKPRSTDRSPGPGRWLPDWGVVSLRGDVVGMGCVEAAVVGGGLSARGQCGGAPVREFAVNRWRVSARGSR